MARFRGRRDPVRVEQYEIPTDKKQLFAKVLMKRADPDSDEDDDLSLKELETLFEAGLTNRTYVEHFKNLLWLEEATAAVNLQKYNMKKVQIVKEEGRFHFCVPGLSDNRPSLMPGDTIILTANNAKFEGTFKSHRGKDIAVVEVELPFERYLEKVNEKCDVAFVLSRVTFVRMHAAVTAAVQDSSNTRRVFPRENFSATPLRHIDKNEYLNPLIGSNPEQRLAVAHIVSGSSGAAPFILHGPPGTGKTVTIVEAILQLVQRNSRNKILVCADSNMAADNVACSLLDLYCENLEKFNDYEGHEQILVRFTSSSRNRDTISKKLVNYSAFSEREIPDGCRIVVATLSHTAKYNTSSRVRSIFGSSFYDCDRSPKFTHLFIDEAAQASEPATLIPITRLLKSDGALVLAGDNKQLGPVVLCREASRRGLGLSLMERLHRDCPLYKSTNGSSDPRYSVMLRNNFRSHRDILALPNELFYKGKLRYCADANDDDPLTLVDIMDPKKASRAIIFHGLRSEEMSKGQTSSFWNPIEVKCVTEYIMSLTKKHGVEPKEIGVISPYILQVSELKKWQKSQEDLKNGVEIGTVESFQGKEKRVIIISTVRAENSLGFLVDDKRFNVALTRAKAKVIVIGNPMCLSKDKKWRRYMKLCRKYGTYLGFNPEQPEDDSDDEGLASILASLDLSSRRASSKNQPRGASSKKQPRAPGQLPKKKSLLGLLSKDDFDAAASLFSDDADLFTDDAGLFSDDADLFLDDHLDYTSIFSDDHLDAAGISLYSDDF